jgi:hypothetical protein
LIKDGLGYTNEGAPKSLHPCMPRQFQHHQAPSLMRLSARLGKRIGKQTLLFTG